VGVERIGKYEILDKIGEGGFGVVYHGRDPFIKRDVALKTCTSSNEEVRRRFFREAEIAGNLHHPNIVTVHDFGLDGDLPFLVQEYLPGRDLDTHIASGESLSLDARLRILDQVARALAYAHERGVIHRDVKPANIRILDGLRVKVMDFGIARLADHETRLTRTGTTLGTVAYLAPEQLRGKAVDHRADLYSFGVVAYELLCGRRPFDAPTLPQLFYALLNQAPKPLRERGAECPVALERLVHRCLEKLPEDRYADFGELRRELRALLPDWSSTSTAALPLDTTVSLPPGSATGDAELDELERVAREEEIRQAAALLIGESEGSVPTDEIPTPELDESAGEPGDGDSDLVAQAWSRIEDLLANGRSEEAGIHISRLRPLLGNHPSFRRLGRRVKAARRSKLAARSAKPEREGAPKPDVRPPPLEGREREGARRRMVAEIEGELRRGRLEAAHGMLEKGRHELGGDPAFDSLASRITHMRTLKRLQDLVSQGRKAAADGDYELAQRFALDALKVDAAHLEAKALFRRAEASLRRLRHGSDRRQP
jgi:serine/threonine protein kinase